MRVLCVSPLVPCFGVHGGGGRVFRILQGLARRHEIHLVCYYSRESELEHVPALRSFCAGVQVVYRGQTAGQANPFGLIPPYFLREWSNPLLREAVATELGSGRHDVLLVEFLEATCAIPRVLPIPALFTHHEVQYATLARLARKHGLFDKAGWKARLNALRMIRYESEACARFDRIFVMTPEDASALGRYGRSLPVEVSRTGVDSEHFQPVPEADVEPDSLVFTGYYEHYPNTDAAVHFVRDVLPLVRRDVPGCRLYLVGSHPLPEVLELAKVPGVTVTGRVPDLRPWIGRATAYIAPIRLGQGIRGKVLEAMAMGKAVVSTRLGAAGLGVKDGQELLIADDPGEFAAKTVRLLREPALRGRLGAAASELVRGKFGWESEVERYHRTFEQLAADSERIRRGRGVALPTPPSSSRAAPGLFSHKAFWPAGAVWLLGKALASRLRPGPSRNGTVPPLANR